MNRSAITHVGRLVHKPPIHEQNAGTCMSRGGTSGVGSVYEPEVDYRALADELAVCLDFTLALLRQLAAENRPVTVDDMVGSPDILAALAKYHAARRAVDKASTTEEEK